MRVTAVILGAILLIVAVRGTETDSKLGSGDKQGLWPLLKADFEPGQSGQKGNFLAWFAAILVIGALGYIPHLEGISTMLLALVIVVLLLSSNENGGGIFQQLAQAVTLPQKQGA
jgi:hypothetical protein